MIIDTHAHYDDEQFDVDREELLTTLPEQGISAVVSVGATLDSCKGALELAEKYDRVYATLGVHPDEASTLSDASLDWMRTMVKESPIRDKIVAIGEIGLDYYWDKSEHEVQEHWFREQMRLARELGLPVNIHSREAAADTWQLMKEEHLEEIGGIIHCYSYSWEMARNYLDAGFYLGIGGVVTFKNAKKLKEVVEKAPLDRLVLETDCPYLAPEPFRGKRNCSAHLKYVAEGIAALKGVTPEEVIARTRENALTVYPKLRAHLERN